MDAADEILRNFDPENEFTEFPGLLYMLLREIETYDAELAQELCNRYNELAACEVMPKYRQMSYAEIARIQGWFSGIMHRYARTWSSHRIGEKTPMSKRKFLHPGYVDET